ncbi:hypothetical protein [Rhizobium sp. Leaf262]|uniref:hypothetical protein n=1 Tax=Rhizobium sp. Leaf262 TaxID=1736312 RepID=UPI0007154B48|nr:hypothetical protein [Rhizobium sp. Leaf262]KQO79453.1 hypothetical protein ASF29_23370 [Rhizobium sp. Leaf262]
MIPQLPTDNLYKFTTLGGIIIIGFCLWTSREHSVEIDAQMLKAGQANSNFDLIHSEVQSDQQDVLDQLERVEDLVAKASDPANPSRIEDAKKAMAAFDDAKKARSETKEKTKQLQRAGQDFENQSREMELLAKRIEQDTDLSKWLFIWGSVMTFSGMSAWYFRHQRYQDELLKVQLENARKQGRNDIALPVLEEKTHTE